VSLRHSWHHCSTEVVFEREFTLAGKQGMAELDDAAERVLDRYGVVRHQR
jgi:hypothetical protein